MIEMNEKLLKFVKGMRSNLLNSEHCFIKFKGGRENDRRD
jgi:hypothetical protein